MTLNVLNVWGWIFNIGSGIVVLLLFGITFSPLIYKPKDSFQQCGSSGKTRR